MVLISNPLMKMGIAVICILVIYMIYYHRKRKKSKIYRQIHHKKPDRSRNYLYPFFYLFTRVPVFRKSFEKIRNQVKVIYPGDLIELNYKVTKDMLVSMGASFLVSLLFIVTSGGDLYYIALGISLAYVLYVNTINSRFEKADKKLLTQFYTFLTDVRHNYYISGKKVNDAVYMSIDEAPYEMSLHASIIHKILCSVDRDKEIDRYVSTSPNRFILSFVAISSSIMEYSDKVLANGKSMFLTNIGYLKDEVHAELDRIKKSEQKFKMKSFVAVMPVFLIKGIQFWANTYLPEIKDFYSGVYGVVIEVLIFGLSIIAYTLVVDLKDRGHANIREHKLLSRISRLPVISAILTNETNRNYSKSERVNDKLKLTGEHMGYKQFLLKKILCAAGLFVAFQVIMITSIWQEKKNILTDFSEEFNTSYISNEEYEQEMIEAARMYVENTSWYEDECTVEELQENIIQNTSIKRPLMAQMVAETVVDKINEYNDVYYRWWYLLISVGIMMVGFNLPMFILNSRIRSIKTGMEDEVVQYQTIVMMLMYTDNITIKIMLEWIERFSYCFKESINTCINELPHDEERALKKLRDSETFYPFKRFINNFLCINEQGVVAAFDEIVQEHENALKDRETDNEIQLNKRSQKAGFICIAPLAFEVIMYLIYPMTELAGNMQSYLQNFG